MKLTLGPVLFNWEPDRWRDFYFRIADEAPVDTVAIGEVVCFKRAPFFAKAMAQAIERLAGAGKEVMLSSLALVAQPHECRLTAEVAGREAFMVEANDTACLAHLGDRPHAIGPFVNIYNEATAAFFAGRGARRICLPPELPASSIATIAAALPEVEFEVFGFGRLPLAISARCYHARHHQLSKDNCRFVCAEDPDGLVLDTLDGDHFLAINGVQTLSYTCANLIGDVGALTRAGVAACRLSPHSCDMVAVANRFRQVIDRHITVGEAMADLAEIYPDAPFSNGFLHGLPGVERVEGELAL